MSCGGQANRVRSAKLNKKRENQTQSQENQAISHDRCYLAGAFMFKVCDQFFTHRIVSPELLQRKVWKK
jgi:hypothetical protein